jgi:hypothetical protein
VLTDLVNVSARTRLLRSLAIGVVVGVLIAVLGSWQVALLARWMAAGLSH